MTYRLKATLLWLWISWLATACTTQTPLHIPESSPTMIEIYQRHAISTTPSRRDKNRGEGTLNGVDVPAPEAREIRNPVIHIYVFPHVSASDGLRLPGFWTSFGLYDRHRLQDTDPGD